MTAHRTVSLSSARRLAISKQRLAGPRNQPDADTILDTVRDLGCLQLDPISVVARSHQLVLWSRLGNYNLADVDKLLWEDRSLFEYWAHCASIVLTEDYPVYSHRMHHNLTGDTPQGARMREWLNENRQLCDHIMSEITEKGPMRSSEFEDKAADEWYSSGWTSGRNVSKMLDTLWWRGILMVAGRSGIQKLWDLTERCLPQWTPRDVLETEELVRRAAQRSLRSLGVASANQIKNNFVRGYYPGLTGVLRDLLAEGLIARVDVRNLAGKSGGDWYIHRDDLALLENIEEGEWQPRTTLLSPFDNLICDRARSETLFDFNFRIEIYVPKEQRKFGYYVLPILHGDRLIGRIDPTMDRKQKRLVINAVHTESDAPLDSETGSAVRAAIDELACFLGASQVQFTGQVSGGWGAALQ